MYVAICNKETSMWCRQWSCLPVVEFEILTMNGNGLSNLRPSLSEWHDETCQPHLTPLPLHCIVKQQQKIRKGVSGCSHRAILSNKLLKRSVRESSPGPDYKAAVLLFISE